MAINPAIFTGDRLIVKPFGEDDWINLKLIRSDPGFRKYMLPAKAPLVLSDEHYQRRAIELARGAKQGPYGPRLIYLKYSGEMVGSCGIINTPGLPLPELSFCVLNKYRRQGYCLEAARLLLKNLNRLSFGAFVEPDNSISLKILEGLGLTLVSSLRHPFLCSFGFWYEQKPEQDISDQP